MAREVDAAYASGYDDGLHEGRTRGMEEGAFHLRVPCAQCGKCFDLDFTSVKAGATYWRLVRDVIQSEGWHHGKCP